MNDSIPPQPTIQPYLYFDGRCEEALQFYQAALGAEVLVKMRFDQSPEPSPGPTIPDDKIMHAQFRVGDSLVMASDGYCWGKPAFEGFALTFTAKDAAEVDRVFAALADGGQVKMPLDRTFFSPRFGMVTDRFGISWTVLAMSR